MRAFGAAQDRRKARRELIHQYLRLQRELAEGDPASSAYQASVHAFRQLGFTLIASGFEDDLDRLLRVRVVDGARPHGVGPGQRSTPKHLFLIEQRPAR